MLAYTLRMATKLKADEPRKLANGKYDKSDPKYYGFIGKRGGKKTVKTQGPGYFERIARVRHNSLDDSASAPSGQAASDKPARPRKSAGSRVKQ